MRQASYLRHIGFFRFDACASHSSLGVVAEAFDRHIVDDDLAEDLGPPDDPGMHRYLVDAHDVIPELGGLLCPEVQRTIHSFYRSHFRVRSVRASRNRAPLHGTTGHTSTEWHLDPEITSDLRLFVYLTPATRDNGALETIDRATTRRVLRSGYIARGRVYGSARLLLSTTRTAHEGPAGTSLLIDPQRTMHRAGRCAPGQHRDIVQFWITPSTTPLEPDWCERLPPDPTFHGGLPGHG
jgi:hypothetical protein